jgi:hypothetical protein
LNLVRVWQQILQHGQRVGGGLAAAGLRLANHILSGQHHRDHRRLNRHGGFKTGLRNGLQQFGLQFKLSKFGCHPISNVTRCVLMTP